SIVGNGTGAVVWAPDGSAAHKGTVTFGRTFNYTGDVSVEKTASLTVNQPTGPDDYTLDPGPAGFLTLSGTSVGGTVAHSGTFSNVASVVVDAGVNDGAATTVDTITVNSLAATGLQNLNFKLASGNDKFTLGSTVTSLNLPVSGGTFSLGAGPGT